MAVEAAAAAAVAVAAPVIRPRGVCSAKRRGHLRVSITAYRFPCASRGPYIIIFILFRRARIIHIIIQGTTQGLDEKKNNYDTKNILKKVIRHVPNSLNQKNIDV